MKKLQQVNNIVIKMLNVDFSIGLIQFTHHIHIRTVTVHASTRFDKFKHDSIKRSLWDIQISFMHKLRVVIVFILFTDTLVSSIMKICCFVPLVVLLPKTYKCFGSLIVWCFSVPQKGYSRHTSVSLNEMSWFLFYSNIVSLTKLSNCPW
jgi:hypothetical protein